MERVNVRCISASQVDAAASAIGSRVTRMSFGSDAITAELRPAKQPVDKKTRMKPADRTPGTFNGLRWFRDTSSFGEWSKGVAEPIQRWHRENQRQTEATQAAFVSRLREANQPASVSRRLSALSHSNSDDIFADPKFTGSRGYFPGYGAK